MTLQYMSRYLRNLKVDISNNHYRIASYDLRRSSIPIEHFHQIIQDFDKAILRVGNRMSLSNESAVDTWISPVPRRRYSCLSLDIQQNYGYF